SPTRQMAIRTANGTIDTARSSNVEATVDNGRITRGKYTLLTRAALPTMDMLAFESVEPNTAHASIPAKQRSGYGISSLYSPAITPKTKLSIPVASRGCRRTNVT